MSKKKVAFFGIKYFPSRGGTSRVAENLIKYLSKDFDITIYCYRHPEAENHLSGVKTVQFRLVGPGSLGVLIFFFRCSLHIFFRSNYDLIHAHKIDSAIFLRMLSKRAKVIATTHEIPYKRDKWGAVARWFLKKSERSFLNFSGTKTSISKPLSTFYKEKYDLDIHFIPNGINPPQLESLVSDGGFWPEGIPENTSFVLFAARRIMGTKGLHTLLKALKKVEYQGHVFVAGESDNYPTYMNQIQHLSKGLNIHYLGFVHPLPNLLSIAAKADYFVFPSETEGMSIMLLEVASLGKPIIASDIPENTQVFGPNEVVYFKNKNVDDLAEKLRWAEKNEEVFKQIGQNAQRKVLEHYTWKSISEEYKELYLSVLMS